MTKKKQEELEQKYQDIKEKYLRCMADMQNIIRRSQEERIEMLKTGSADIISKILPVIDNFERAINTLPEEIKDHNWTPGIIAIEKILIQILNQEGLEQIAETGIKLDPSKHEPLMIDPEAPNDTISEILEKGYILNGKIIRTAKVKVGNKN
ncbi:MAG: nucleotide exchange factor GrpE [Candidatus Gracilibacteria bacterium]|jgi:molecular chaperone GrpE|nr:nucleotide exchange factor GrpE [Candidatus Gracilibacteria bacterium]